MWQHSKIQSKMMHLYIEIMIVQHAFYRVYIKRRHKVIVVYDATKASYTTMQRLIDKLKKWGCKDVCITDFIESIELLNRRYLEDFGLKDMPP